MLCIDLQGYELNALKSMGDYLDKVKYVITESSIESTYIGGAKYKDLHDYMQSKGFRYVSSNVYGEYNPIHVSVKGYSEFDVLFARE